MLRLGDLAGQSVGRIALARPDGGGRTYPRLPLRGGSPGGDECGGEDGVRARTINRSAGHHGAVAAGQQGAQTVISDDVLGAGEGLLLRAGRLMVGRRWMAGLLEQRLFRRPERLERLLLRRLERRRWVEVRAVIQGDGVGIQGGGVGKGAAHPRAGPSRVQGAARRGVMAGGQRLRHRRPDNRV
jgi:hypothetical protein